MKNTLTKNQARLLHYISVYRLRYGSVPTLKEMVRVIRVSDNKSVLGIIEALIKKGYITRRNKKSRSILLTKKAYNYLIPSYEYQKIPSISDQLRQPVENGRNDVTVPSFTNETLTYKGNAIKTDGTMLEGDIQTLVETVVGLTIDRYFNGDSLLNKNTEQKSTSILNTLISIFNNDKRTVEIFKWGLLLTFLAWLNSFIFNEIHIVIGYSLLEAIIINKFLIERKNYESWN